MPKKTTTYKLQYSTSSKCSDLCKLKAFPLQKPYDILLIPNTENIDFVVGQLLITQEYFDKAMYAKDLASLLGTTDALIHYDSSLVLTYIKNQGYELV